MNKKEDTILIFSDIHAPFQHCLCIDFLKEIKKVYKPTIVLSNGDLIDQYSASCFRKNLSDMDGADKEFEKVEAFVEELQDLFPELIVLDGNHDSIHNGRVHSRGKDTGIPTKMLKNFYELFDNSWRYRTNYETKNLFVTHGTQFSGKFALQRVIETYRKNTVIGHLHSNQGIIYNNNGKNVTWAATGGCLMDTDSYAAAYGKKFKDQPLHGCVIVTGDNQPIIESLEGEG